MATEYDFDDGDIEPYDPNDPRNEPHPDHVVYREPFNQLTTRNKQCVSILRDPVVASEYQNATTKGLVQEIKNRCKEDVTQQTMIALCGDMGSGKSSLINSLLSVGTIARCGASGDSCTWVVQRFMQPFPEQNSPFAARVSFFSNDGIHRIIASLVAKYYRATDNTKQEDDEPEAEDTRSEDFTDKRAVLDTFKALFCDQEGFEDDEAAQNYLSNLKSEDDEEIVDKLTGWAEDLAADHLEGEDCIILQASTTSELLRQLQPYTYQLTNGESDGQISPWPIVNVVDFGLDNFLLNKGIVLVDTPGISDSDGTRASNAIFHHRQCTHKITVADVGRAKNDKVLRESLAQGFGLRGSSGNLLVLTKGDNIDGETEVSGGHIQKQREFELLEEIKAHRNDRSKLMRERRKLNRADQFDIEDQMRDISSIMGSKIAEYDHIRACMRKKAVAKAVSTQYRELTGDAHQLSVHVVANNAYKKYQAGCTVDEKPFLSVKETGIPDLRTHIFCLPAQGQLNDALHLAKVQLPNMINLVELYCSKTHMTRKSEIEAILRGPANEIDALLQKVTSKLKSASKTIVLEQMTLGETRWSKEVRVLCRKWAGKHTRDSLGIMKKEGFKKGRKGMPDVSWNRDILQLPCVKVALEEPFEALPSSCVPIYRELSDLLDGLLTSTRSKIRNDPQFKRVVGRAYQEEDSLFVPQG